MNEPANSIYSGWCSNQWWLAVSDSADDRRKEPRVFVGEDAAVMAGTNSPTSVQLVNLSPSGALVLPEEPFDIGTVLGFCFELPDSRELQCAAIVRTCLHEQANGLAFLGLSAGDRCLIDNLVRRPTATHNPKLASQVENAIRSFIYERDHAWSGGALTRRRIAA